MRKKIILQIMFVRSVYRSSFAISVKHKKSCFANKIPLSAFWNEASPPLCRGDRKRVSIFLTSSALAVNHCPVSKIAEWKVESVCVGPHLHTKTFKEGLLCTIGMWSHVLSNACPECIPICLKDCSVHIPQNLSLITKHDPLRLLLWKSHPGLH